MKFSDIKLADIGNTVHMVGAVYADSTSYRSTILTEAPSWAAELWRLSQQGIGQ